MDLVLTGLAAFAAGFAETYLNYRLSRAAMESDRGALIFPLRTLVTALFITALFLLGCYTGLDLSALMIGGALGCTVGLIVFTLVLNKEVKSGEGDNGKE